MNIVYSQKLLDEIKHKIKGSYKRQYVDYFYNKLINEKFSYVFYGMRRIGKTTMCLQILNQFIDKNVFSLNEIAYVDVEFELSLGNSSKDIKNTILNFIKDKKIKLIFFDEVQMLEQWDMFIKSLNEHFLDLKIICSGSSSYNLREKESGVGRFNKVYIQPLTLSEFEEIRKNELVGLNKKQIIDKYLKETPFFEIWDMNNDDEKKRFLISILEKTIINDLNITMNRSFTQSYIKQIIREIALSETGELSFDKIQSKFSIPKTTFYEYLSIMQNIKIITILERYNGNLVISKRGPNKYYLSLPFFYKLYLDDKLEFHQGKIYESLLLMHLDVKYNIESIDRKIFYIKDKHEIDFYIPDKKIGYELKTNNIEYNELYMRLNESGNVVLKTLDIEDLYDFIKSIKLFQS